MMVEDHPVSYIDFEGEIPAGNYGAGTVIVWDKGAYFPINEKSEKISEKQALSSLKKGELKIFLKGKKMNGEFVMIHLKNDDKRNNSWLLIKHRDKFATDTPYNSEDYVTTAAKKAGEKRTKKK